jgi:uridine kinase
VYVEADEQIMLKRRIIRDTKERGYPIEDIHYQWEHHVMPAYRKHLLPYKSKANLLVHNNSNYTEGLQKLLEEINDKTLKFN